MNTSRSNISVKGLLKSRGLHEPFFERDACGVGLVADVSGRRTSRIISQALEVLCNLEHRGARGSDPDTGDGAGILIHMPHRFMLGAGLDADVRLPDAGRYAVAMVFLPQNESLMRSTMDALEEACLKSELSPLGWRRVPTRPENIGKSAAETMPDIRQLFVAAPPGLEGEALERRAYLARKRAEARVSAIMNGLSFNGPENDFYICSFSSRTIIYKGLLLGSQVEQLFPDLASPDMESGFGLVHSRFSTNTLGSWKLAHPYRLLAHNGEINTLRGNVNWMSARERTLVSEAFGDDIKELLPICERDASDTASLDNVLELLTMSGRSLEHAASMMLPSAWYGHESMPPHEKEFYEYHFGLMESWDGPAMIVFTDGRSLGATLDRNGLRPFRYCITKDNLLVMASETGALPLKPEDIKFNGRLAPGRMFLVKFDEKRIEPYEELMTRLASQKPYGEWLAANRLTIDDLPEPSGTPEPRGRMLTERQAAFGYTQEDLNILIRPMSESGEQPLGSMGNDVPLPAMSERPQPLFSYFKQLFAQVSNPPLDAIREKLVTQMAVPVGRRSNILEETAEHCRVLRIDHPVMSDLELAKVISTKQPWLKSCVISTLFNKRAGTQGLKEALERVLAESDEAIKYGATIIVLSDRGVDANQAFIPSLLACSSLHHHLIRNQRRGLADVIVESGEPREVHHFATLFGYGASAVNPYLVFETLADIRSRANGLNGKERSGYESLSDKNYIKAAESGVLKTISKMGVSTLQSYIGAQQFEALGLSEDFIDEHFTWTPSRIGGIGIHEVAEDVLANHERGFPSVSLSSRIKLDTGGLYMWRSSGERHGWNPDTVSLLQQATIRRDWEAYLQFEKVADKETADSFAIRGMLEFKLPEKSVPLKEVEPAEEIVKRFATGAISLGSISKEAHETLAIAMNRIGARSNTGEGGEDPARFVPDSNGDYRSSAVKQVASGRFGVTASYLSNAKDLQIKMAQGAKPGEGGEIPGLKISEYIAYIRKTTPGVGLISPPPHHDIYSIEDLAQLIHDLKNVNPESRVHVKLVSEVGVGIIAAGVSKGKGDVVLISGDSGGTGASPLSSIRHAGLPWELGVAETQQVLVENGLRDRIVVQTDGHLKTAKDVIIAALFGAEEWGIATGALVAMGCIMLRKCHLNTCSVGVATQNPELRRRFAGTPEAVVNYFLMLSERMRHYMAQLGFRTVNEMVGRADMLKQREDSLGDNGRTFDLSRLLFTPKPWVRDHLYNSREQDHDLDKALDNRLISAAKPAIELDEPVQAEFNIRNVNRSVGAMLSGKITKLHGERSLPDGSIKFVFKGSAGQSFGAFLINGVEFRLEGDANDYLGKGLSGGRIIVVQPASSKLIPEENVIIGNVALYGATSGEVYIRGLGGERFCVRNSAAWAVIEGVGDHCCEYMTGGRVAVIGPSGRNVAAGMSGGIAYILNHDGELATRFNTEMADLLDVSSGSEYDQELRTMIENHARYTDSSLADAMLADWHGSLKRFKMVMPKDYARVLKQQQERSSDGNLTFTKAKEAALG